MFVLLLGFLYLSQSVADTLYPFCDLILSGVARQEVSKLCHLRSQRGRGGFSRGYLRFLGICRTIDPSLEEVLQLQRLQQQLWQE